MKSLKPTLILGFIAVLSLAFIGNFSQKSSTSVSKTDTLVFEGEKHFKNMKMLTNWWENAECYFSFDGARFVFS